MFNFKFKDGLEWLGEGYNDIKIKENLYNYSENFDGWNDELTDLHEQEILHPIDVNSITLTLENLKKIYDNKIGITVLEIGSSNGYLTSKLIKLSNFNVIASDVINKPLIKLSKKLNKTPIIRCDINNNPFLNESLDCVICLNVLEHIENDLQALKNIYKILKPNGIVILELPFGEHLFDSYDESLYHFRRYSTSNIVDKVKSSIFDIIEIKYVGVFLYPIFYLHKKILSKVFKPSPMKLIKKTSSKFFKLLLNFDKINNKFKFFKFGIRIRLVLRKKVHENAI